jgi:hypothetical protein
MVNTNHVRNLIRLMHTATKKLPPPSRETKRIGLASLNMRAYVSYFFHHGPPIHLPLDSLWIDYNYGTTASVEALGDGELG